MASEPSQLPKPCVQECGLREHSRRRHKGGTVRAGEEVSTHILYGEVAQSDLSVQFPGGGKVFTPNPNDFLA